MYAAFEVSIAGKHGRHDQIAVANRVRHLCWQRSGIADAGRATVAHQVESDHVEVLGQTRLLQILGDDLGARREARLDPRFDLQAAFNGLFRDEPSSDHHGRVRRVRATGDGGNHDGTVAKFVFRALDHELDPRLRFDCDRASTAPRCRRG